MTTYKPSHLVPKLRFPKFEGAGDWEEKQLSSLVKLVSGVHLAPDMYSTTGEVPYFTGPSDFTDAIQCVAKWTAESVNIAKQHDTLITVKGSGVGKIWYLTLPSIAMGRQLMAVRTEVGDRRFIYQFLSTRRAQFEALASGNLIPGLSRGDILGMAAYFPSRDEQKKISDCLGSLDDLIAAEGRQLEALRQHKQGLMQQLFPQPGETVPRLRVPEFQNAGAWEEEKLDDLARRGTGHTPKKAIAEYYDGGIKWVSLADSKRLDNGLISETEIEISEEGINNSSAVLHPAGSVILSRDAGVGKRAIISCSMAVSQHFIVWPCEPTVLSNWFFYYQLQLLKPLFERVATGSTIKTIGLPFFNAMRVTVPRPAEQHRIADCLSMLEARLAAQVQKLNALKTHKQGLLQQLFPPLESQ